MRQIDELHLEKPFYGARKIAVVLSRSGHKVGRKRVTRLMRLMGIETMYRKPNLSRRHPQGWKIYPYLLRNIAIDRIHQVWSCDITYIPIRQGFLYLVGGHRLAQLVGACRGGCPTPWTKLSVSKRCKTPWSVTASRKSSTAFRVFNLPARYLSQRCQLKAFVSAWTAKAAVSTTSSASACGAA